MSQKKHIKRIFSFVLATVLLISAIPLSLAVQNLFAEATNPKIIREVTELREESVKHFLCEDGSYIAATYAAPVHYKENGEWKEIDNSLSLDRTVLSVSGKPTYTTKAGGLSVSIPQSFSDGQKITAKNKGYEIGFGVNANQNDVFIKASASVVELETLSSNTEAVKLDTVKSINNVSTASTLDSSDIEAYNAELMTVDNQSSAVTYKEIMPDTDFEYIVTGNSIKENIVVYEPQSEYTYSFDMDFDGLVPVVNPDNSISLIEPNNPDETIFFIEAPYMYDSNGEESIDIDMSLVANGDEYVMTLVASAEWINDESRAFPVVIDPTINILASDLNDVFVIDGLFANSTRINNELRVGRNLTNVTRTYIKPELPTNIPVGSRINSAVLRLYKDSYYQAPSGDYISVYVYDCSDVAVWEPDEITWNNQPYNNSNNGYLSTNGAARLSEERVFAAKNEYDFDIRFAVQQWVNGGVNNGLMLVSSDESMKSQIDFVSSRASDSAQRPQISIQYTPSGTDITEWIAEKEASTCTVFVTSAILDWTVTSNQPWLTVPVKNTSNFRIAVSENTGTDERSGEITVSIGDTVISTIEVIQYGTEPTLLIDKQSWNVYGKSDTTEVTVTSNDNWNIIIDDDWVTASVSEGEDNAVVTFEVAENTGTKRETTVTFANESSGIERTFRITQLDIASSYFCEFDSNGNITFKDSSQYNHNLATWAMELSYAAYNPIQSQFLPLIPSSFMHTPYDNAENTSKADLLSKGFLATEYNYEEGADIYAAHTIGHREIIINDYNTNEGGNDIDFSVNNDVVIGSSGDDSASFSSVEAYGNIDSFTISGNSGENILNSTDNNNTRQLVVVAVRGSVTFMDWVVDLGNQINDEQYNFQAGMKEVIKSLYGCTELCDECKGVGCENASAGYLDDINDPIILITGHSLGAAIANLTANYLTQELGADNVYAYTFATPNTVNKANEEVPIKHDNIFNILNNNDAVPHFPMNLIVNEWERHGQDFHITMPWVTQGINLFGVDLLGALGHGMPTYYSWMNNLPGTLGKSAKDITVADLDALSVDYAVGLGAKLFKVLCPVSVALYDSDGNVVAYESQQDGVVYPETINTGIVSWIADDGGKMFLIPYGTENIEARIEAYDYGTMDFTIETMGVIEPLSSKTFNDVSLYPGKEFLVEVSEETLPEDTQLFVTENGEIVGEITDTNPFFKGVTVNPTEAVYGETVTFTLVTDNTVTAMMLHNTNADDHVNLVPGEGEFNVVSSGENELTWTVTNNSDIMNLGENVYDLSVQSDGVWYFYENVIALNVTVS